MTRCAIGVDLGGTKTAVGLVDETGRILERIETATPARAGSAAIIDTVIDLVRRASERGPVSAVGVGAAGVIDADGTVVAATDALPGWAGTPVAALIAAQFGVPAVVVNDVHAHGIGEGWIGAAAGYRRSLVVAAGTGLGGAWVVDGEVDPGAHFVAGHLGHIPSEEASGITCSCGRIGHLEAIASGPSLHAEYLRRGGDPAVRSARELTVLVADGDPLAREVVRFCGAALGRGIGGLANMLDPDIVVVSGGLASIGGDWWSASSNRFSSEVMDALADCRVVPSELGGSAAILGAARLALTADTERGTR